MKRLTKQGVTYSPSGRKGIILKVATADGEEEPFYCNLKEISEMFNRLVELEDKIEDGELVELPKPKWVITRGQTFAGYNYCLHKIKPTVTYHDEWPNERWTFSYDVQSATEWRVLVAEFDDEKAAKEYLKELKIVNGDYVSQEPKLEINEVKED